MTHKGLGMKGLRWLWLSALVLVLDQATKVWAVDALLGSPPIVVMPGMFDFSLVYNSGAAFGLLGVFAGIPESAMFAGFLIISVAYYGMFTRVWKALTFLSRSINRRAMAKIDRRVSDDRRQGSETYYVDGIPKERRSGTERRHNNGDRRNGEDDAGATIVELEQGQHESLPDDQERAAKIGTAPAAGNRALYN